MFSTLEIIISRAALWPDLHLIKSSVLISSVPLSFDVKKHTSVFLLLPPGGLNRVTFRFGGSMHFSSPNDKTRMDTPSLLMRKTWRERAAALKGEEVEERGGGK